MSKVLEDAKSIAKAATDLTVEIANEEGTAVNNPVSKVTITYADGSTVDFSPPAGDTSTAPVVAPVNADPVPTPVATAPGSAGTETPPTNAGEAGSSSQAESGSGTETDPPVPTEPLPEGAAETSPTIAGVVPQ